MSHGLVHPFTKALYVKNSDGNIEVTDGALKGAHALISDKLCLSWLWWGSQTTKMPGRARMLYERITRNMLPYFSQFAPASAPLYLKSAGILERSAKAWPSFKHCVK